ncbi:hypothetical protein P4O66_020433 [Electrophorus voltai]|uniref:Sideroflexin 5b n=1 Tax=Electrophorus voltai TaxID=2609070 RepID=A0AAD8ZSK0_9TELE|nr:hypothetical protein P4O66_020433 [Electrophorus voltai]
MNQGGGKVDSNGRQAEAETILIQNVVELTKWLCSAGLFRHFIDIIDPRTLFVSELWEAQKVKQAIIHPDTGQKIFMPFRMSGGRPSPPEPDAGIHCVLAAHTLALSASALTRPSHVRPMSVPQWLNQSHNACVNYANRNATKPTATSRFIQGYLGAVTSAVSIAVGLNVLIEKSRKFNPATRLIIQRFIPFPAVASANICNVALMRHNELSEGIDVLDRDGNVVGSSRIAAKHALMETAFTRVVLPLPIFVLPPVIMAFLEKLPLLRANRRLMLPMHSLVCLAVFGLSLPLAISLFPQMSEIEASHLEPEIAMATDCKVLTYNKGL